ncbi:MAG: ATP-binding cassette domain-containing protein [Actinomycetota bacterium]|nr:ATP-binding cassette domain-containing protein [Actinomycetota bacterium]
MSLLETKNLNVSIGDKEILKGIDLRMEEGEIHVLMGPNACGKTTLALAILGYPAYRITKGTIIFDGQNLTEKDISERAKLGIALGYQSPPVVRGVKLRDIIRLIAGKEPWNPYLGICW